VLEIALVLPPDELEVAGHIDRDGSGQPRDAVRVARASPHHDLGGGT
jgi:hypothetical protein